MSKRRGHGEGGIYQRESDGRWCASVDLGLAGGSRRRKVIYGKTRKEVADKLKALHRDQVSGRVLATEQQTVKQFLETWLEQRVKHHNRPRTYQGYQDIVENHLVPHIGAHQLEKLSPEHVQTMLNTLTASGLSPRTVSNVRAVLRKALNQALRWGLVYRNVATLVDAPRTTTFSIQPLDQVQAQQLLDAVAGHRLEALYRVALSLGLRRGEVCGLRWEDVDLERATLRVTGSLQRVGGRLERAAPKTAASVRTIALPPVLRRVLERHRARQEQEQRDLGAEWQDSGLVFVSERGTPLDPRNVVRHFKTALARAKLPEATRFHDLRHSCATLLIAQGVYPRVIMEILGHSQISTTMNTYAHVLPETQREATHKIDSLFPDAEEEDAPDGEAEAPDAPGAEEADGGEANGEAANDSDLKP
jgi:integrase